MTDTTTRRPVRPLHRALSMIHHSNRHRRGHPAGAPALDRPAPRPGRPAGTAAFLSALTLALAACGGSDSGTPEAEAAAGQPFSRVVNVETRTLAPERFVEEIRLTGTAAANRDVTVSAQETGEVVEILVDRGDAVAAGQPLLRINDRLLRSQVDQARAAAELARETWERRRRLWEEDQVGSELAYLEARYSAEQAAANLRTLEERLERTVIRAPVEGLVEERRVELGTLVSPGTPVVRIVDVNPMKVTAGVPERYAPDVEAGTPVNVAFDVLPGARYQGTVTFVGATVTPRDRTFPVEIRLPNPRGAIKPQMVAGLRMERRVLDEVLVVPQEAVLREAEGFVVYVVEERDGEPVAVRRAVEPGPSQQNRVVILEGLSPGDRLVVVGQQSVADGERVRTVAGVEGS